MPSHITKEMSGWGRYPIEECRVFRPEKRAALETLVAENQSTLLARGLGRSYGDAALNADGLALQERFDRFICFDEESGTLDCEGGVSLDEIIRVFGPRGWFLPVSPGTKFVTVGGALACDIHGKNHHRDGSFSEFVEEFDLLLASGETLLCSRENNAAAFWATVGGLGLTGIITRVRFRLRRVASSYIAAQYERLANLDALLEAFSRDQEHSYSVAWIDCLASGDSLGRSVLIRGEHATPDELSQSQRDASFNLATPKKRGVPLDLPDFVLNPFTIRAFNAAYYAAHPSRRAIVDWDSFFYPLDAIENWNRIYGARGFIQYQLALPFETSRAGLIELLEKLAASRRASFLAVLKSFGPQNPAPLSFPLAGHTLALDIPFSDDLPEFARELDEIVLRHNGRVYLAKDALLSPQHFRAMYPRWKEWLETKQNLDPQNRFSSSLARRLEMLEDNE